MDIESLTQPPPELADIQFRTPPLRKRVGERFSFIRFFVGQVTPADITQTPEDRERLLELFPSLAGDQTAIGPGDDGGCPDWVDYPGWWREYVDLHK